MTEHERKGIRIDGPAHRRPRGSRRRLRRPKALMTTRRVRGWIALTVAVLMLGAPWGAGMSRPERAEQGDSMVAPQARPQVAPSAAAAGPPAPSASPSGLPPSGKPKPPLVRVNPSATVSPARRPGHPRVSITAPREGTQVHGGPGVLMTGTARDLGRHQVRIFDYAPNGVYYVADGGPVTVSGGSWSFRNGTMGAGALDVGKDFVLVVVLAGPACQNTLRRVRPDARGDLSFPRLPPECPEADSVRVHKVAP
ncbi:hypothetical protein [Actinomadura rubrisoli]|uniref:Uncharacterized protein n=1 Tax=Actinomadura rubrisoli TaxID=2530368 RepID=A0A4R5AN49_9ACTN|nr:hypothetical protein [Actinomadura rubrisoli]TDD73435.1 hypothetical protein E1298_34005 [Actinomadura rubrisoli]